MNATNAHKALRAALAMLKFAKDNIKSLAPQAFPPGSVVELTGTVDKQPVAGHALLINWTRGQAVLSYPDRDHLLTVDPENLRAVVRKATALEVRMGRLLEGTRRV